MLCCYAGPSTKLTVQETAPRLILLSDHINRTINDFLVVLNTAVVIIVGKVSPKISGHFIGAQTLVVLVCFHVKKAQLGVNARNHEQTEFVVLKEWQQKFFSDLDRFLGRASLLINVHPMEIAEQIHSSVEKVAVVKRV